MNPGLQHCRQTLYRLSHQGSPYSEVIAFSNTALVRKVCFQHLLCTPAHASWHCTHMSLLSLPSDPRFWGSISNNIYLYLLSLGNLGLPCGSDGKEYSGNAGDLASIPRLGRSPGEGDGYPLQCSGLENSIDYTEEPEIKLPTSTGSSKKQESS